jgi:Rrf2 family protein
MIRMNRTTEYALLALKYMSGRATGTGVVQMTSAREIAERYGLPFEITAKTLQRLKDLGFIESAHGSRGGYLVKRALEEVTLTEFLSSMEGTQAVVACVSANADEPGTPRCEYLERCEIQSFMGEVNGKVLSVLSGIRLSELVSPPSMPVSPSPRVEYGVHA